MSITSDQGKHVVNKIIKELLTNFMITHNRNTPYHTQANEASEALNKIIGTTLTKMCDANKTDRGSKIPVVLWGYQTTYK